MPDPTVEEEVKEQKALAFASKEKTAGLPPKLPKPGDPGYMGPVLPTGPTIPTVLRGRARFEYMVNQMGRSFGSGVWGHDFNTWVMGLKDDPSDPEFNLVLRWARAEAQKREAAGPAGTQGTKTYKGTLPIDPSTWKLPEDVIKATEGLGEVGKNTTTGVPGSPGSTAISKQKTDKISQMEWEEQLPRNRELWKQTVFKGGPEAAEMLQELGVTDPDLQKFLEGQGITLDAPDSNISLRSGAYVYMGKEYNSEYGAERDVYMYGDDAKNALATIDPAVIQSWQTQLGLDPTGKIDPDLAKFWDYAVSEARRYAATGNKVSVRDLMDMYVASAAKERARSGGGGGGGGSGLGEDNPEDQAAVDYYRAMMAILGDISGVPNAES